MFYSVTEFNLGQWSAHFSILCPYSSKTTIYPCTIYPLPVLGVIFDDNFKFNTHIDFLLKQRVYLLKLLRSQGMSSEHLHQVTIALKLYHALVMLCLSGQDF